MKASTTISIETYNCRAVFCVTDTVHDVVGRIYRRHGVSESFDQTVEGVCLSPDMNHYYVVLDLQFLSHNTLAHELFHTVCRITEDRGIQDEEAAAWLAGYLTERAYKFLQKKNLPIKHG